MWLKEVTGLMANVVSAMPAITTAATNSAGPLRESPVSALSFEHVPHPKGSGCKDRNSDILSGLSYEKQPRKMARQLHTDHTYCDEQV